MPLGNGVKLTWLGHATFLLETPGGKRALIDPWITGNPKCPESLQDPGRPRSDPPEPRPLRPHRRCRRGWPRRRAPPCSRMIELADWFGSQGVENAVGVQQGRLAHGRGHQRHADRRPPLSSVERRGRHHRLHGRAGGPDHHARERLPDLLRRRHERVRRHGPDRRAVRARPGDAADRRLLHDGPDGGGEGRRAARREARPGDALRHLPALAGHAAGPARRARQARRSRTSSSRSSTPGDTLA